MSRVVHWKREYKFKNRASLLLLGSTDFVFNVRINLQKNWLISKSESFHDSMNIAKIVNPVGIFLDTSFNKHTLFIERAKRDKLLHSTPIVVATYNSLEKSRLLIDGANAVIVLPPVPFMEDDIAKIEQCLKLTIYG